MRQSAVLRPKRGALAISGRGAEQRREIRGRVDRKLACPLVRTGVGSDPAISSQRRHYRHERDRQRQGAIQLAATLGREELLVRWRARMESQGVTGK